MTGQPGGDGFAFVIQNTSSTALGLTNSYMGYEISNSLAAEFDTWRNSNFLGLEPSNNHVGVQSAGTGVNNPFAGASREQQVSDRTCPMEARTRGKSLTYQVR